MTTSAFPEGSEDAEALESLEPRASSEPVTPSVGVPDRDGAEDGAAARLISSDANPQDARVGEMPLAIEDRMDGAGIADASLASAMASSGDNAHPSPEANAEPTPEPARAYDPEPEIAEEGAREPALAAAPSTGPDAEPGSRLASAPAPSHVAAMDSEPLGPIEPAQPAANTTNHPARPASDGALLPLAPGVIIDEAEIDQETTLRQANWRVSGESSGRMPALRLSPLGSRRGVIPIWAPYATLAVVIGLPLLLMALLFPALSAQLRRAVQPDHLPALTTRLEAATATTHLDPQGADFGAQTYPVAPEFSTYYAAHNGPETLGPALTPAFTSNLGETQFFTSGALINTGQQAVQSLADSASDGPGDLDPGMLRDGVDDSAQGIVALGLNQELLALGSAAPIGGADSGATYATLRAAAGSGAFLPAPKVEKGDQVVQSAGAPKVIVSSAQVFVIEGTRGGASAGHSVPLDLWTFITRADVAPQGWLADIGEPLTEPLMLTATVNGAPHHLLVQAFAQATLILDQDSQDASGAPQVSLEPAGRDYLQTEGGPAVHASGQAERWLTADGALRKTAGSSAVAVGLNSASAVTLSGPGQWVNGALWYAVTWTTPTRTGQAWVSADALAATAPGAIPLNGFDALSPTLAQYLAGRGPNTGVVAYDITRGVMYTYNPRNLFIMASSAKVPLLVSYLEYIESQGRGPNSYEISVMTAMIEQSDNNAAQVIYDTVGYDGGQRAHMRGWGITDYVGNPNGWGWGRWSPGDMARLLALLQSGKVLNASDRNLAFYLMSHIESDQRFGVGDSAPSGAQVWMKDGWVPGPDGAWAVNSSGIVKVGSETYIVTVYNGELNSFGQGEDIVNHVCGAIGQALK